MKQLYIGDNGRIFCKDCAGVTARSSGMKRDLSGAKIVKVTQDELDYWIREFGEPMKCESFSCN